MFVKNYNVLLIFQLLLIELLLLNTFKYHIISHWDPWFALLGSETFAPIIHCL